MEKYRLQKSAVRFFDPKYATAVYPLDVWEREKISINALQQVESVRIEEGHVNLDTKHTNGWSRNDDDPFARFHFTLYVSDCDYKKHQWLQDPVKVREMLDIMNKQLAIYINQEIR